MRTRPILTLLAIILILAGGYFFVNGWTDWLVGSTRPWYAVHLNNGQVYFGHLSSVTPDTIVVADTYFLEAYQQDDAATATSTHFTVNQTPKQIYRLVKRGDEKNLATDHTLNINRAPVLFWEKLNPDAEVVKLINAGK